LVKQQRNVVQDVVQVFGDDVLLGLKSVGRYVTAPLRFSGTDWLVTASVLGGTAALMPGDEPLNQMMLRNQTPVANGMAKAGRVYGEGWTGVGLSVGVYALGMAVQNDDVRVTGRLLAEALVCAGLTTTLLKSAFGRARPYNEVGAFVFQPPQLTNDAFLSLPSGHTTVAFALSSVLAERIGNPFVSIGLYGLAALTGLSRMYHTKHWASDVLLGAAIGTSAGLAVTAWERERASQSSAAAQRTVSVYPVVSSLHTGIGLTMILQTVSVQQ
jgi:membrane-associated phospholipid phosphatase